jgi:hypothetical protein
MNITMSAVRTGNTGKVKFSSLNVGHIVAATIAYQAGKSSNKPPQPLSPQERKFYSSMLLTTAGILMGFLGVCVTAPLTGLNIYPFHGLSRSASVSKPDMPNAKPGEPQKPDQNSTWHLYPFK